MSADNEEWPEWQMDLLRFLRCELGLPVWAISKLIGRTYWATVGKIRRKKLSPAFIPCHARTYGFRRRGGKFQNYLELNPKDWAYDHRRKASSAVPTAHSSTLALNRLPRTARQQLLPGGYRRVVRIQSYPELVSQVSADPARVDIDEDQSGGASVDSSPEMAQCRSGD